MALNKEEVASHVSDLIRMSLIDHQQVKIERIYIEKVAARLGIDPVELSRLYEQVSKQKPELDIRELPDQESEIIPLFHRLLILITVDGNVKDEEIDLCRKIALQMGLNLLATEEILKTASKGNVNLLTPDFMSQSFKKYYN